MKSHGKKRTCKYTSFSNGALSEKKALQSSIRKEQREVEKLRSVVAQQKSLIASNRVSIRKLSSYSYGTQIAKDRLKSNSKLTDWHLIYLLTNCLLTNLVSKMIFPDLSKNQMYNPFFYVHWMIKKS